MEKKKNTKGQETKGNEPEAGKKLKNSRNPKKRLGCIYVGGIGLLPRCPTTFDQNVA